MIEPFGNKISTKPDENSFTHTTSGHVRFPLISQNALATSGFQPPFDFFEKTHALENQFDL